MPTSLVVLCVYMSPYVCVCVLTCGVRRRLDRGTLAGGLKIFNQFYHPN